MIKTIYIYNNESKLNKNFIIIKKCLLSWKLNNPLWKVIEINDHNLMNYINIEKDVPNIINKNISIENYSYIISIIFLEKYGGCWCDCMTFCNNSLDSWLEKYILDGFFTFNMQNSKESFSLWFLYCEKNNYIIKMWKNILIDYLKENNIIENNLLFNNLYNNLYNNDKFKKIWNSTPKLSIKESYFITRNGIINNVTNSVKNHINNKKIPIYNLSYNYSKNEIEYILNNNCNLSYLLNKNYKSLKLRFIHIPKTGGTSIENAAIKLNLNWGRFDNNLKSYNNCAPWHCPQMLNNYTFCVIRNPYDRFISQFYHDNKIENYTSYFLNKYITKYLLLIRNNIHISDNHFLQQYKFCNYCYIAISFDNLQENLNKVTDIFNIPILELEKLPGGIKQQTKRNNTEYKILTVNDIDESNKRLIENFYKYDFELYNKVQKNGILVKNI